MHTFKQNKNISMHIVPQILIGLIIAIHLYILWLEMFAWTSFAPKVFKNIPKDLFPKTKNLAANQGLYNGFLAAGLIWSFFISDLVWKENIIYFFLACIFIAGIFGAVSASKKILWVQSIPALLTFLIMYLLKL
jgi:putative membrane protein